MYLAIITTNSCDQDRKQEAEREPLHPTWDSPRLLECAFLLWCLCIFYPSWYTVSNSCRIEFRALPNCVGLADNCSINSCRHPIVPGKAHESKSTQSSAVAFKRRGNGTTCFTAPADPSGFSCFFSSLSYIVCQGHSISGLQETCTRQSFRTLRQGLWQIYVSSLSLSHSVCVFSKDNPERLFLIKRLL